MSMLEPSIDPTSSFDVKKEWVEKYLQKSWKKNNENDEQDLPIFKKIRQIIKQK